MSALYGLFAYARPHRARLIGALGAMVLYASASAALAQLTPPQPTTGPGAAPVRINPPIPRKAEKPPTLINIFVMVALGAGIIGAAMIPSKRGHQD